MRKQRNVYNKKYNHNNNNSNSETTLITTVAKVGGDFRVRLQ